MPFRTFCFSALILLNAVLCGCFRKALNEVQSNWNRDRAKALVEQAQPIFTAGDYGQNVKLLQEATSADPSYGLAWSRLCLGAQFRNEWEIALKACRRAVEVEPSEANHSALGQILLKARNYSHAAEEFARISSKGRDVETQSDLVTALLYSGQYERAAPEAQRLVELTANQKGPSLGAYQMLAVVDHQLGRSEQEAEALGQLHTYGTYWRDIKYCEMAPDKSGQLLLVCLKPENLDSESGTPH